MASANERRWAGGAGARILLKSKGLNQTTASFISVLLLTLHFFRQFFALVVFRLRRWSVATSAPLLRHQLRPSLPPVLQSRQPANHQINTAYSTTIACPLPFTNAQIIQQAPPCSPHQSIFPPSFLAPLSSSSSPSLYTLPHCCAGSNASAINMKLLSRYTC